MPTTPKQSSDAASMGDRRGPAPAASGVSRAAECGDANAAQASATTTRKAKSVGFAPSDATANAIRAHCAARDLPRSTAATDGDQQHEQPRDTEDAPLGEHLEDGTVGVARRPAVRLEVVGELEHPREGARAVPRDRVCEPVVPDRTPHRRSVVERRQAGCPLQDPRSDASDDRQTDDDRRATDQDRPGHP